ncbi:MAG: translocation/assembly module TamB domain-containing protein, partial [Bacteroidia bacterium]|nr:translocation/assembly module TamB domain-containing protein [Bacteroidia bacterium]
NGSSKTLSIHNNIFSDFSLSTRIRGNELSLGINSRSLELLRQSRLDSFRIDLSTKPDNLLFSVNWGNKNNTSNKGSFVARGYYHKNDPRQKNAILTIDIDSTDIYSRKNLWKINSTSIVIDSNAFRINRFLVGGKDYYYSINGAVSEDPNDTLDIGLKGIDIIPLNFIITRNKSNPAEAFSPEFRGNLNGNIILTNFYKEILLQGNLTVRNFGILGTEYGTLSINSAFDVNRKVININAGNNLDGRKILEISGFYDPPSKKLDLTGIATKLSIQPLNPLLKVFASDISGTTTGKVNLVSIPGSVVLNGALFAENSLLKIDYLQTKYRITDSVRFDRRGINFNNVKLTDERGNPATLSGTVFHRNFKNFQANLTINTTDCMVLNTKAKDNELFYGTAYATGVTTIKSSKDGSLAFDISARSGRNTKFYIPLNTGLSVSEVSFVSFINGSKDTVKTQTTGFRFIPAPPKTTDMDINMDLEVTPVAEVQLIFDETVGDIMKANGSGNLNISYNKKDEFRITGDYIIDRGDYLFTLGNILNKPFSVENGGKIMFNGDIYKSEIDLKAIYKLRASVADIIPDGTAESTERVPVECQLNLSGNLFNPTIGFDIYLPTADEKTRTYLRNAIATEEQMSRQFLYLLVMNSFYPDPLMGSGTTASSGTAGTAAAVTTSEMLFSQLSNMLSKISNDFDIGVVYRPGVGNSEINSDQLEVALSKQILNDKVVINGNFDVRGSNADPNTNQITGDFDAEVKITEKIRFKVFNRYNNPYTGKSEPYTQGVGVFFRQEFNKIGDLFRKKEKPDIKKEDETSIKKEAVK